MTRQDWRALAFLSAVLLAVFGDVLFLGRSIADRDLILYHFPMKKALRELVTRGGFPLWNPLIEGGSRSPPIPSMSCSTATVADLSARFLFGFNAHIVLHLFIAAIGMYLLLRALGVSPIAGTIASIGVALSDRCLRSRHCFRFSSRRRGSHGVGLFALRRRLFLAALALAMQVLVGEPVILAATAISSACCFARAECSSSSPPARSARCNSFRRSASRDSVRSLPLEGAGRWSMPAIRPIELLFSAVRGENRTSTCMRRDAALRRDLPFITSIYLGVLPAVLALAGLVLRRGRWLLFAICCGAAYVLAIGVLPSIPFIRYPEKFFLFALIAIVVYAAMMLELVLRGDRALANAVMIILAIAGVAAVGMLIVRCRGYAARYAEFWHLRGSAEWLAAVDAREWLIACIRIGALLLLLVRRQAAALKYSYCSTSSSTSSHLPSIVRPCRTASSSPRSRSSLRAASRERVSFTKRSLPVRSVALRTRDRRRGRGEQPHADLPHAWGSRQRSAGFRRDDSPLDALLRTLRSWRDTRRARGLIVHGDGERPYRSSTSRSPRRDGARCPREHPRDGTGFATRMVECHTVIECADAL